MNGSLIYRQTAHVQGRWKCVHQQKSQPFFCQKRRTKSGQVLVDSSLSYKWVLEKACEPGHPE
jgi:hypothetical protein